MTTVKLLTLFVFVCVLYAGCHRSQGTGDNGLTKFEFLIDWQAEPTYLGIYYAKELGEFRKLGLDVNIVQSRGANQAVNAVAAGGYKIATASGGATVLAYNNDAEIVSLGVLYPKISSVVFGLATSGIRQPDDLKGKKIGIYPGSITKNEFDAFLKARGLDQSQMQIVSLTSADIPLLLAGQVDGVLHYSEMSPVVLEVDQQLPTLDGRRAYEIPLAEYGVKGYGLNIVTSRDAYNKERELLESVAKTIFEGYRKGCENPENAVNMFLKEFPEKDRAYVSESWRRVCQFIGPNPGYQTEDGWRDTIETYRSLGLLKKEVNPRRIMP